jgi:hypothetical protein
MLTLLCVKPHKTYSIDTNNLPNYTKCTHVVPPPQWAHVEPRPKTQKTLISNSPTNILFAIQRKSLKFPQNNLRHLVTLFLVCLRVFPLFELSPKKSNPPNLSNSLQLTRKPALSHRPIIKGLLADLILTAARLM